MSPEEIHWYFGAGVVLYLLIGFIFSVWTKCQNRSPFLLERHSPGYQGDDTDYYIAIFSWPVFIPVYIIGIGIILPIAYVCSAIEDFHDYCVDKCKGQANESKGNNEDR